MPSFLWGNNPPSRESLLVKIVAHCITCYYDLLLCNLLLQITTKLIYLLWINPVFLEACRVTLQPKTGAHCFKWHVEQSHFPEGQKCSCMWMFINKQNVEIPQPLYFVGLLYINITKPVDRSWQNQTFGNMSLRCTRGRGSVVKLALTFQSTMVLVKIFHLTLWFQLFDLCWMTAGKESD